MSASSFPSRRASRHSRKDAQTTLPVAQNQQVTHQAVATPPAPVPVRTRLGAHIVMLIVGGLIGPLAAYLLYEGAQLSAQAMIFGQSWASPTGTVFVLGGIALFAALSVMSGYKSSLGLIGVIASFFVMAISIGILTPFALENAPQIVVDQILLFGWSGFTPALLGGAVGAIYGLAVARRRAQIEARVDMMTLEKLPEAGRRLPPAPADRRVAWTLSTLISSLAALFILIALFFQVSYLKPALPPPVVTSLSTPTMVATTIIITLLSAIVTASAYLSTFGVIISTVGFMVVPALIFSIIGVVTTFPPIHSGTVMARLIFLTTPVGILGATLLAMAMGAHWARKEGRRREITDLLTLKEVSEDRAHDKDSQARKSSSSSTPHS